MDLFGTGAGAAAGPPRSSLSSPSSIGLLVCVADMALDPVKVDPPFRWEPVMGKRVEVQSGDRNVKRSKGSSGESSDSWDSQCSSLVDGVWKAQTRRQVSRFPGRRSRRSRPAFYTGTALLGHQRTAKQRHLETSSCLPLPIACCPACLRACTAPHLRAHLDPGSPGHRGHSAHTALTHARSAQITARRSTEWTQCEPGWASTSRTSPSSSNSTSANRSSRAQRRSVSLRRPGALYNAGRIPHTPPCLSHSRPVGGRPTRPCWWGQCTSTQGQPLLRAHGSGERKKHAVCCL